MTEIERKWLVPDFSASLLATESPREQIEQVYLSHQPEVRMRLVVDRGANEYATLTLKAGRGLVRSEYEMPISPAAYRAAKDVPRLTKLRYVTSANKHWVDIDVYDGPLDGLVVAEVEFDSVHAARAFTPPDWFGREVTDDKRYSNAQLAVTSLSLLQGDTTTEPPPFS